MRVGQASGAEQLEGWRIINLLVELDDEVLALLDKPLLEHGIQHGVELLLNVLDEHGFAEGEAVVEDVPEVLIVERSHPQLIILLAVLEPVDTLALRIHQHGVPRRTRHHDAVLDRDVIRG